MPSVNGALVMCLTYSSKVATRGRNMVARKKREVSLTVNPKLSLRIGVSSVSIKLYTAPTKYPVPIKTPYI